MFERRKESQDRTPALPSPLRELLSLAAPTIAQMASYTLMQFIDTWILSRSSQSAVIAPTAAANAGILAFAVISLGMGVMFVVNTLVSQSFGHGDRLVCGQFFWQAVWFSVLYWLLLLPTLLVIPRLFRWVGHEPALANLESIYLRIVVSASILKLLTTAAEQFFLGINRPFSVALATICGVGANAMAAWILIMGRLGIRPMGVAGSATAQNIGVGMEAAVMLGFLISPTVRKTFGVNQWRPRLRQMLTLIKIGIPSGLQIVADVLAWSAFTMWVMSAFRTEAMAANIFVFRYMSVSFMPAFGISVAVTALVGRYIGQGKPDVAVARANLGFAVTAIYMVACGSCLFLFRRTLIGLFTTDATVLSIGQQLLIFAAVYQFFDALYIVYNGALRGAGDTLVPAVLTGVLCWGITVFGGRAVAVYWPQLGPAGPWMAALTYGVILGVAMWLRFARGHWRTIQLLGVDSPLPSNVGV